MRRSSEPEERAQFTVAELLARYGEPTPATGRRRRRVAEDTETVADTGTVAQTDRIARPIAEPSRAEPTMRSSGPLLAPDLPVRHGSPHIESTQPSLNTPIGRNWAPAVDSPPVAAGQSEVTGPAVAGRASLTRTALPDGPVTDQLPRFDPLPVNPAPWSSHRPVDAAQPTNAGLTTAQSSYAQPPAGLGTATCDIPEQHGNVTPEPETRHAESGSPLWEWAAMVSQVGIGVVGGAALWLVCEWLWQRIPVVALVVALAVITGLVWVVRRVRRAEDLQTTVIAVLVGLFVTVSPAALLLVGR